MNRHSLTRKLVLRHAVYLAFVLFTQTGPAAESTQNSNAKNVEWEADGELTMTVVDNIRTLNLSDNVIITQGSLKILGDTAILKYDVPTQELVSVTVYGAPVDYRQQLGSDGSSVSGTSQSILLVTEQTSGETVVELSGDAFITSPDSTMRCAAIVYVPDTDLIRKATGPCTGTLSQTEDQEEE